MTHNKYRSIKGWYKAVILPHGKVNRLHKYRANTVSGWEILFWSACADVEPAKADFERHHEPLKDLAFEKAGIPFSELPGKHYFSFVLPEYVSDYSYIKQADGTVEPLVIAAPIFDCSTIVEDMGGTSFEHPQFRVIALDRTQAYQADLIQRCGGRIYDVFLYDASRATHLCELPESYECHYIESFPEIIPEDDRQRKQLYDDLEEANVSESSSCVYFHCSDIDAIDCPSAKHQPVPVTLAQPDEDDERSEEEIYKEWFDEVMEYVRGNSLI